MLSNIRIYVDAVINHMTGEPSENVGTGGSTAVFGSWYYPAVPYTLENFNWPPCGIDGTDYANNAWKVRLVTQSIALLNKLARHLCPPSLGLD